jgi:hypothetical protein
MKEDPEMEESMANPENQANQSPTPIRIESPDSLSEEELEPVNGGILTARSPQALRLSRSFSESDLSRLAQRYPNGIHHAPHQPSPQSSHPPSPQPLSPSSSSSGDIATRLSPNNVLSRYTDFSWLDRL